MTMDNFYVNFSQKLIGGGSTFKQLLKSHVAVLCNMRSEAVIVMLRYELARLVTTLFIWKT